MAVSEWSLCRIIRTLTCIQAYTTALSGGVQERHGGRRWDSSSESERTERSDSKGHVAVDCSDPATGSTLAHERRGAYTLLCRFRGLATPVGG